MRRALQSITSVLLLSSVLLETSASSSASLRDVYSHQEGNSRLALARNAREIGEKSTQSDSRSSSPDYDAEELLVERGDGGEPQQEITDYTDTMREGGLEGSVGTVVYDTPNKLQDKVLNLYEAVGKSIQAWQPRATLPQLLQSIQGLATPQEVLSRWEAEVPLIAFIRPALSEACPLALQALPGDPSEGASFPRCLLDYLGGLAEDTKRDLGKRLREFLSRPQQIQAVFNLQNGLCIPAAEILELPKTFCNGLLDVLASVPPFISASAIIQEVEKEHYSEVAAMLQIDARATSGDKGATPELKLSVLGLRLAAKRSWQFLALASQQTEAKHLVTVWYNDPIHKWRYVIGLVQWFAFIGTALAEGAATSLA